MTYATDNLEFAPAAGIQELGFGEIDEVGGGIVPLALAGAVLLTTVQFSFIAGVFDGIAQSASRTN